jgi:hypothetical protein
MFSVFKQGRRVTLDYLVFLILFAVFLPLLVTLTGKDAGKWMPYYSLLMGLVLTVILWPDIYDQAVKEKKKIYNLDPSPHKGILIVLVGFAPYIVLTAAAYIFTGIMAERMKLPSQVITLINNAFLSPVYFISALLGNGISAHIAACLYVPLTCYLAYFAGNKGITRRGLTASVKRIINNNKARST